MLGARGATGADTSGGALALILRVGANTDDARRKMKALDDTVTKSARWQMKQFRTAFTTFFSVSAMRTLVLQSLQFARNFHNVRAEVERLGIAVDEEMLKKAQMAEIQWRKFVHELKISIMGVMPRLVEYMKSFALWVKQAGAFFGALSVSMQTAFREARANKPIHTFAVYDRDTRKQVGTRQKQDDLTATESINALLKGFEKGLDEAARAMAEVVADQTGDAGVEAQFNFERAAENALASIATGIAKGSLMIQSADSLAKIGGYRGGAYMESQLKVAQESYKELAIIRTNTETLRGGVL
jgi:hypothetical protein